MVPDAPPTARISNSFRRRLKSKDASCKRCRAIAMAWPPPTPKSNGCSTHSSASNRCGWRNRTTQCVCGTRRRGFYPRRLHGAACGGGHAIDVHALECDDEVIAVYAGVADRHRFSMMFNTHMSDNSRYSPGLILMRNIVDHYARAVIAALDLGRIGRL